MHKESEVHSSRDTYEDVLARLSPKAHDKLAEFSSSSSLGPTAGAVALSWMHAGGDQESFIQCVSDSPLGASFPRPRALGKRLEEAWSWAESEWDPAYTGGGLREELSQLREEIRLCPAMRDPFKASALALVDIAIAANVYTVHASSRQLSEITGHHWTTSSNHMEQFQAYGFVTSSRYRGNSKSREWVLDTSWRGGGTIATDKYMHIVICSPNPPLWTKYGLGPTALRIFQGVPLAAATKTAIAKTAKADKKTAGNHLPTLAEHNLVVEVEEGLYALNLLGDQEEVATSLGVAESKEAKRRQHDAERTEREERMQEWRESGEYRETVYAIKDFTRGYRQEEAAEYIHQLKAQGLPKAAVLEALVNRWGGNRILWSSAWVDHRGLGRLL